MDESIRIYLLQHLAPVLSRRFKLDILDVENVINTFDKFDKIRPLSHSKRPTPPPKITKVTKDILFKEAKTLGLKVTMRMKKAEIQAVLDEAKIKHRSRSISPQKPRTPHSSPPPKPQKPRTPHSSPPPKPQKPRTPHSSPPPQKPAHQKPRTPSPLPRLPKPRKVVDRITGRKGPFDGKTFTSQRGNIWKFGKLLGTGGFGDIYAIADNPSLVIKVRNDTLQYKKTSGIYLEKAIYLKIKDEEGDKHGVVQVIEGGVLPPDMRKPIHDNYFIVLPRFEVSLKEVESTLTPQEKKKVVNDVLDTLKFLSTKCFIHLDIKSENVMKKKGRWFLIDYGIAQRFDHTIETTPNPKKAGDGSPGYMARDAHKGLMSRKADLESLVYLIVEMEGHELPWMRDKKVGESDVNYLNDILRLKEKFFRTYKDLHLPQYYNTFIEYVNKLTPGDNPNYDALMIK
jgi:hypothetical protein